MAHAETNNVGHDDPPSLSDSLGPRLIDLGNLRTHRCLHFEKDSTVESVDERNIAQSRLGAVHVTFTTH